MITSWLMRELRRQDWIAVCIELLTVIFGLFFGLQLNAWKDARDAQDREHTALVRLERESEEDVVYYNRLIDDNEELNRLRGEAIAALETNEKSRLTPSDLGRRLRSLTVYSGITPPRAVHDELAGAGLINEINSTKVREAVANYYVAFNFIQSQLDYFRASSVSHYGTIESSFDPTYVPKATTMETAFTYMADFDTVSRNRGLMAVLVDSLRNQIAFQNFRREVQLQSVSMCKVLAEAIHASCAAAALPLSAPAIWPRRS